METAVDRIAPLYLDFPGFRTVTFFMDEGNDVCGTFSEWDTREAAEEATAAVAGRLTELVSGIADADFEQRALMLPARLTFEIYQPKPR